MVTLKCVPCAIPLLLIAMVATAQNVTTNEQLAPNEGGWTVRWNDHPEIDWSGRLRVEIHARVQSDGRMSDAAVEDQQGDTFDVGRRRIGIQGDLGRHITFEVEREIERMDPWRDVWINYRVSRIAQVQAGQFKIPFGLEETTGLGSLTFIYRSLVSRRLAPGRDRGLMLHGRLAGRTLGYEVGMFAHDGDNARPNGGVRVFGGRTVAGRVVAEPFHSKAWWSDFQMGAAFTSSQVPVGFPAIRGRSLLGVSFFDSDVWVEGTRTRVGLQAQWRPGPFSITSELIRVADDRRGQSPSGTDLAPFLTRGWYVSGAWVVAGASRVARVATPLRPLFHGGFGSIQLAGRLERFRLGGGPATEVPSMSPRAGSIAGNGEDAMTIGLSWYPNRWIRIDSNLIRETIGDASQSSYPSLRFWSRLVRLQVSL